MEGGGGWGGGGDTLFLNIKANSLLRKHGLFERSGFLQQVKEFKLIKLN